MIAIRRPIRGSTQANRHTRAEAERLLREAKATLAQWHRLHYLSVAIGRAEQAGMAEGDLFGAAIETTREIIERSDRIGADIARHLMENL